MGFKRSKVNNAIWNYNIGILGESGVGKTTLMSEVCEKLVGDDGYVLLNVGKEDGVKCIENITYEDIPNYKAWDTVTNDIIKNKTTEYPNLKIVVIDTLDQLFDITEPEVIRKWNADNVGKKDFVPAKTLNAACGGFGRGEDAVIDLILDRIWKLKAVGIAFFFTGHTKNREISDALTGQTYSSLTTNMMQRYFTAVKTKTDILGIACVDREIIKEKTGKKNIVTKQEETRNKVAAESRIIKFRDDNYSVDSKSRFANIVDEIPLNSDAFIEAIQNAISSAQTVPITSTSSKPKPTPVQATPEKTEEPEIEITLDDDIEVETPAEEPAVNKDDLMADIRSKFKAASTEVKTAIKAILKEQGTGKLDDSLSVETLIEIQNML